MKNLLKDKNIDWAKWIGLILLASVVGTIGAYGFSIRHALGFTILHPKAVGVCAEGYFGEHGEADRRFELKQKGEIAPLIEEAKKE